LDRFSGITGGDAFYRNNYFGTKKDMAKNIWKWDDYVKGRKSGSTYEPNQIWGEYSEIE